MVENSIMAKARAHWAERLKQEPKEVHVPEWDATLYVFPASVEERNRYYLSDGLERAVDTVLWRAKDESGSRVFQPGERGSLLRRVDGDVLLRVAAEILEADNEPSIQEAAEDLPETQS